MDTLLWTSTADVESDATTVFSMNVRSAQHGPLCQLWLMTVSMCESIYLQSAPHVGPFNLREALSPLYDLFSLPGNLDGVPLFQSLSHHDWIWLIWVFKCILSLQSSDIELTCWSDFSSVFRSFEPCVIWGVS